MSEVDMPLNWSDSQLNDVASVVRSRVRPKDRLDLAFIGMDSVEAHTMRLLSTASASEMKSAAVHFLPGDVLYGRLRPYLNKVLAVDFEGLASAEFIPLTPALGVVARFLQYRLNSSDFVSFASHIDEGDRPRVDYGQIAGFKVQLPPLAEQHRIVEAIDSYFTRLDDAMANLKRVQRNLKRYRASVLKAAVEGRLVPTEAELARAEGRDYEPASVLLERILAERRRRWEANELEKIKTAGKSPREGSWRSRFAQPAAPISDGELPEGWCWSSIDQLAIVGTGATPKRGDLRYWKDGEIPWVTSAVVNERLAERSSEFVTAAALEETNLTVYPPGTLLVAMYGEGKTRGRVTTLAFSSTTNQALAALQLPAELREWVVTFLEHQYQELRRAASGGVQPNLNLNLIRRIQVPLPPAAEQRRIVNELQRIESVERVLTATGVRQQAQLTRLRQSILKWAFEGRLADQDPNDEPASVLLERIKAERAANAAKPKTRRKGKSANT